LKIETQELEERQIQITIEVPPEKVQAAMRSAARRIGRQMRIPGFRPGKAPYEIILRRVGEEEIFEEALESLGQEVYRQALDTSDIEPYGPGSLEEVVSRDPLVLCFTVPLSPKVDLGDYRALRVPYEPPEIGDEDVEKVMEELRQRQALIEPVERPAQLGDILLLDIEGDLLDVEEGEEGRLVRQEGVSYLLDEEEVWPFPGAAQELVGLEAGQEKTVEITFPEDYPAEEVRGKRARFKFTCHEVKSRSVPEWSDDLAREVGDFDDLDTLRAKVRQDLTAEANRRAEEEYGEKVIEALVEGATMEYPPRMLEEEIGDILHDMERRLQSQGLSMEDYLKLENKTAEDLRKDVEPQARRRLERALVLGKLVEAEGIEVSAQEIDAEIDRLAESIGIGVEQARGLFDTPGGRRRVELELLTRKAIARLVSIAKGEIQDGREEQGEADAEAASPQSESTVESKIGSAEEPAAEPETEE
jgi:trigger factor